MFNTLSFKSTIVTVLGLVTLIILPCFAVADSDGYVYKQSFNFLDTVSRVYPVSLAI